GRRSSRGSGKRSAGASGRGSGGTRRDAAGRSRDGSAAPPGGRARLVASWLPWLVGAPFGRAHHRLGARCGVSRVLAIRLGHRTATGLWGRRGSLISPPRAVDFARWSKCAEDLEARVDLGVGMVV